MSKRDEDVLPTAYKYAWFPESELPLQDFLAKVIIAELEPRRGDGELILTCFTTLPV